MKYIVSAILFLFFVGVMLGFITQQSTETELVANYSSIIESTLNTFEFVGNLGKTAVSYFQKLVEGVAVVGDTLSSWYESAKNWLYDLFN